MAFDIFQEMAKVDAEAAAGGVERGGKRGGGESLKGHNVSSDSRAAFDVYIL